jgi:hypothetical protein
MGIAVTRGTADSIIERIITSLGCCLEDHPEAEIGLSRHNSVSIRVRIIDSAFQGITRAGHSDLVWKYFNGLSEEDQSEISSLILLTPAETEQSFANFEFNNPVPSGL